jgi:glycosyltransferase involved in cell wall biosynthesis
MAMDEFSGKSGRGNNNLAEYSKISVVIPVLNEEKFIGATLGYLLNQDYPEDKFEIIVVDDGSADRTAEIVSRIAAEDGRVRLINHGRGYSSAGRNAGVKNATGDIITFIDGHIYIDNPHLLRNVHALMQEKDVSVLSRPQFLETPDNNFFQRAVSLARKSFIGHGLNSMIYARDEKYVNPSSSGASYKKDVFEKVGLFDEIFDACEDVDFNVRAAKSGYKSFTSMKLAVYYYPRESLGKLFKQLSRYGTGRFRLTRKHPDTLSISSLVPTFITAGLPLVGILSIFIELLLIPFLILAVLYLLAVAVVSTAISIRHGWSFLPVLPVIFLTIHIALGWGFLSEMWRTIFGKSIRFRS